MSIGKGDVTIVIPTLNEEEGIGQLISELRREGYDNVLVVDGYSSDNTVRVAELNSGSVVFQHGRGKSGAIETALEYVKTPFMLVMDGDCTYDPKDIERFLGHVQNYDQIIGVRANGRENIPVLNRLGNWIITETFNLLMETKLTDVCSGMYVLRTETARQLEFNTAGFDVEVEIAGQNATRGKITEVPITYRKRIGYQKLSAWRHGFQIVSSVVNLARIYNPALLFSAVAAFAVIPAVIMLAWVAFEVVLRGVWHSGYALTGIMLLLLASQGLTVATISILLKRMERRIAWRIGRS